MRRVRELLRLHYGTGASARAIARELRLSRSTVKEYLARATAAELAWPLPDEFTDAVIEERLFAAGGGFVHKRRKFPPPFCADSLINVQEGNSGATHERVALARKVFASRRNDSNSFTGAEVSHDDLGKADPELP
jgi:hypothetical protein